MSSTETRGSVIFGACNGDPDRWREFDAIYRPILFAFLRQQGLKEFAADEVAQDVLVKLLGTIHTYDRSKCRFRTWLFRVTKNALIDRARREASYKKALEGWAVHVLRLTPSDSAVMEELLRDLHRRQILRHAFRVVRAQVSSIKWTCFEERILFNRPASEIAAKLNIERDAVYVNASRVLNQVRAVCDEFDEEISYDFESDVP
jgi:RNA polymerase sigma-70 factor (ECF subfamily)